MTPTPNRPAPDEYAPFYAGYVASVPEGDLVSLLREQGEETQALIAGLAEEAGDRRYAAGKWSIRQVLGHVADTERVMAYRALRIARGDPTPLPGFEENAYAAAAGSEGRALGSLARELAAVREATLTLLEALPPEAWTRRGTASGQEVSVRALAYIVAGHERHHRRILQERYLAPAAPASNLRRT